uniref:Uncharacterized protein n=1 Tax=Oryza glaberrima TaxID=4538 RepID=I1R1J0_ORYGL
MGLTVTPALDMSSIQSIRPVASMSSQLQDLQASRSASQAMPRRPSTSELDLATASSSARWSDGGEQSRCCGPTRTTNDGRTISASSRCGSGGADLGGGSWWVGWAARLAGRERNTTTPFFSHSRFESLLFGGATDERS